MGKLWKGAARPQAVFSAAGRGGPRRLVAIGVTVAGTAALAIGLTLGGHSSPLSSRDARRQPVDPLPGGLHSTPEQDALAQVADTAAAQQALARGVSFTPPISPSVRVVAGQPDADGPAGHRLDHRPLAARILATQAPAPAPLVTPVSFRAPAPTPVPAPTQAAVVRVAQQTSRTEDAEQQAYNRQMREMLDQWTGRPPQTEVILPPSETGEPATPPSGARRIPAATPRDAVDPNAGLAGVTGAASSDLLVPAGRGIFAHPVLALSSDSASPAIFQADSGRLSGDRMIGTFLAQGNRLVIRITSVIHNGEPIGVDGFVVAPGTMEAGVATGVDQHYLSRFVLPAAAAFVQGLGSAIASSNTTAVISPFGGATTTQHLNLNQEFGVAAGVAASNIGSTLNAQAPKGPTITLDANVSVGVMFLTNVAANPRR
jgi:intracellular multiplication protein IcmE